MSVTQAADRYRMLTGEQQDYVAGVLRSAAKRCMVHAESARADASVRPQPFGGFRGCRAVEHAGNAGALNIVLELLRMLGEAGRPEPPPPTAAVCPGCGTCAREHTARIRRQALEEACAWLGAQTRGKILIDPPDGRVLGAIADEMRRALIEGSG